MNQIEDALVEFRIEYASELMTKNGMFASISFMVFFVACTTLLSTVLTIYFGPGAYGSGVAELIAYVNGINYRGIFSWRVLITKSAGVVLAVVGSLCIGKEGPLAHIGALSSQLVIHYVPIRAFKFY